MALPHESQLNPKDEYSSAPRYGLRGQIYTAEQFGGPVLRGFNTSLHMQIDVLQEENQRLRELINSLLTPPNWFRKRK